MEFISYDEMKEYYNGMVPDYVFRDGSYFVEGGRSCFVPETKTESVSNHVLRTYIGNGRGYMYLGKTGVTFQKWKALKFREKDAKTKASFMRKNSRNGYNWEAVPVSS